MRLQLMPELSKEKTLGTGKAQALQTLFTSFYGADVMMPIMSLLREVPCAGRSVACHWLSKTQSM